MAMNIITLTAHDLAIAYKNKTLFLIVFIPLFVFVSLTLVDKDAAPLKKTGIGYITTEVYPPFILKSLAAASTLVSLSPVATQEEGKKWLHEKRIDGLLLPAQQGGESVALVVVKKESLQTLTLVETVSAVQKAAEGARNNWIMAIVPLQEGGIQMQTLPTWILMLVLLVGFIVMPSQVAEEKEKKLLLALLQTPMREIEWLGAKLLSGMILILSAVLILHLLGSFAPGNAMEYLLFMVVGSFCFSSFGIFLGLLCRNQASARTLGVLFYLPHLLPSALSDFSQKLSVVAPLVPSYHLYEPLQSILLNGGGNVNLLLEWLSLLVFGSSLFFFSYLLMKKRWLM